ncbi:hypothetical protein B7486_55240, partial [cyanobacterium TDX16]
MDGGYPAWHYFPTNHRPPEWAEAFVELVRAKQAELDSSTIDGLSSDAALAVLHDGLVTLGYQVESSKRAADRIRRPVLFGPQGAPRVAYEIDAVHDELGIVVEIEAGRGARGNAVYRDLIRTSLIAGAQFLVLGVMQEYRHQSGSKRISVHSYLDSLAQ